METIRRWQRRGNEEGLFEGQKQQAPLESEDTNQNVNVRDKDKGGSRRSSNADQMESREQT